MEQQSPAYLPAVAERFQILSLDGGGIRGVFSAAILTAIEEDLNIPRWTVENKRNKRFYRLSAVGKGVLRDLLAEWHAINASVNRIVGSRSAA